MRSIWQSLAWKEWHEHKWKLAALSGVLCGLTSIVLITLHNEQHFSLDGFIPALIMGMIPLTIFIGAGEAAGENTARTMPYLQSLPVPMWKAATWKLVFGAIACLVPILLTIAMISAWYYGAMLWGKNPEASLWHNELDLKHYLGIENPLLAWACAVLALVATTVVSILAWTTAVGVNRKSEVSAGALALSVGVIWWTVIVSFVNVSGPEHVLHRLPLVSVMAMGPGGPLTLLNAGRLPSVQLGCAIAAAAVVHVTLFAWYVRRFGRSESIGTFSPQTVRKQTSQLEWLGKPRRSPLSAIIWKQSRESGPIVLVGLAAILAIPAFFALAGAVKEHQFSSDDFALFILVLTAYIGFLVVLIVGIGVFDHDLSPKLHSFWRSRPIDPNLWYWIKYLTGLTVLAVALTIPVVVAGFLSLVGHPRAILQIQFLPFVIAISVYWAVYTLASTTICLVRVAIYAAILSVGVLAAGVGVLWYLVDASNTQWSPADWIRTVTISAFITAVLATLIGWWAVRRDIGWKK